jgi:hypothetical protein
MAMMVVVCCFMLAAGLSVGLLGVLFSELTPTTYEREAARTITGSQAGLQVGLAALRQASSGTSGSTIVGERTKLPCYSSGSPLTGQVGGLDPSQAAVNYAVRIQYFTVNPSGQSAAWRAANELPCSTVSGTAVTPVYALVQSLGYAASGQRPSGWGDRSSEVVYTFSRTDQAVLGGLIHTDLRTAPNTNMCWTAATYPATAGTKVQLAPCSSGDPAQTWSYRTDYSIALSATQSSTNPPTGGLCVTTDVGGGTTSTSTVTVTPAPVTSTTYATSTYTYTNGAGKVKTGTTTATGTTVSTPAPTTTTTTSTVGGTPNGLSLQACQPGIWPQLWAYDDAGNFRGVNQAKTSLSDHCISSSGNYNAGAMLTVQTCGWFTWTPQATVGAGAAGSLTQQMVNYGEYGRCLDITEWNLNATYLIDYPCKQDPTSAVGWNQRWTWDSAGTRQIVSNTSSGPYCLTTAASAGGYVLVRPCDSARADQKWTMYTATGVRSTSYTVVDANGRCLSLGAPGTSSGYLSAWSSITADTCDGSFRQKWNSPPVPFGGNLTGERETTGGK